MRIVREYRVWKQRGWGDVKRKAGALKRIECRSEAKACGLSRTPYRLASLCAVGAP